MELKKHIPNIITFCNIGLGIMAILLVNCKEATFNYFTIASLLIVVATIGDYLDGKLARMFDAETNLGKQLDSLSDVISFGVAPMVVAWKINLNDLNVIGYVLIIIFIMSGVFRLARYNVMTFNNIYMGLPITSAGLFIAVGNIVNGYYIEKGLYTPLFDYITIFSVLILSYLMVSKIQVKKVG
jgi:CDP-diacylglycerol--serine O-phosphatidyltransferase